MSTQSLSAQLKDARKSSDLVEIKACTQELIAWDPYDVMLLNYHFVHTSNNVCVLQAAEYVALSSLYHVEQVNILMCIDGMFDGLLCRILRKRDCTPMLDQRWLLNHSRELIANGVYPIGKGTNDFNRDLLSQLQNS